MRNTLSKIFFFSPRFHGSRSKISQRMPYRVRGTVSYADGQLPSSRCPSTHSMPFLGRIQFNKALQQALTEAKTEFAKLAEPVAVLTSDSRRRQFSRDEGHFRAPLPGLVVSPTSTEQVSQVLKICNRLKVPVTPFGTGTGLEGGSISTQGGVCLSLQSLAGDPVVYEEDFACSVRPATTRRTLNESLKSTGLFFPVDPGADASLCGMAATGASGTNAIRYGTMKENVINLEVVLADGSVINTKGKGRYPRKTSAGYNLTELFVGSEGTLGVITEATLRLHARPSYVSTVVCAFPSIHDAASAVADVFMAAFYFAELLDAVQMAACNAYSKLLLREAPTLFMEFHGKGEDDVAGQARYVGEICATHGSLDFKSSSDPSTYDVLWKARHDAYYAALSLRKGATGFTTDVCVPMSKLADLVAATRVDLDQHKIIGTIVGHVGDGNFHVIMPVFDEDLEEMQHIYAFSDRLVGRALASNGTCTGEHGVGLAKGRYLADELGSSCLDVMFSVKRTLDPNNILNPGKKLPNPK